MNEEIKTDYCIVGGGIAGAILAAMGPMSGRSDVAHPNSSVK